MKNPQDLRLSNGVFSLEFKVRLWVKLVPVVIFVYPLSMNLRAYISKKFQKEYRIRLTLP